MKRKVGFILGIILCICSNVFASDQFFSSEELYTKDLCQNINSNLEMIHNKYPDFTELRCIGTSVNGKDILALKVGTGEKSILINGAHHGREMLTAVLCTDQAKRLAERYIRNRVIRKRLDIVSIWFVPLLNPDGVLKSLTTYPSWKANGRGVDLNRNYPTIGMRPAVYKPSSEGYHGTEPFSEPETTALRDFCYEQNFETAIAYHSAGEIIYWWFYQQDECLDKSLSIAKEISDVTGYGLVPIEASKGGHGFTDWFIAQFGRPAFTLEIGKTINGQPLGFWEYKRIWKKNKDIPVILLEEIIESNEISSFLLIFEKPFNLTS